MEAGGEHGSSPGRALKSVRSWDTARLCPAGTLGGFYSYPTCIRGYSTCRVGGSHPSPRAGAELLLFQLDLGGGAAQKEVLPNALDFPKASVTQSLQATPRPTDLCPSGSAAQLGIKTKSSLLPL